MKSGRGVWVDVLVGGVPVMVAVGLKPNRVGVLVKVGVGCVSVTVGVSLGVGTIVGDLGIDVSVGTATNEKSGNEQDVNRNRAMMKVRAFLMYTSSTL